MSDGQTLGVSTWLLILAIVVPFLLVLINVYVLVYWSSKDDKGYAYFPKFLVVTGLTLAEGSILLLPLDVANGSGFVGCGLWNQLCGGLNLEPVWQAVYIMIAIWVIFLIPFAIFYYESLDEDEDGNETGFWAQACSALKWEIVTLIVFVPVFIIMFVFLRTSLIPYKQIDTNMQYGFHDISSSAAFPDSSVCTAKTTSTSCTSEAACKWASDKCSLDWQKTPSSVIQIPDEKQICSTTATAGGRCTRLSAILELNVSFPIYLMAMMSFIGWFFFVMYAGVGLTALPMDLISPSSTGLNSWNQIHTLCKRCRLLSARKSWSRSEMP